MPRLPRDTVLGVGQCYQVNAAWYGAALPPSAEAYRLALAADGWWAFAMVYAANDKILGAIVSPQSTGRTAQDVLDVAKAQGATLGEVTESTLAYDVLLVAVQGASLGEIGTAVTENVNGAIDVSRKALELGAWTLANWPIVLVGGVLVWLLLTGRMRIG